MRPSISGLGISNHSPVCRSVVAAASSSTAPLSPRQRKLAAKRKNKQQQREVVVTSSPKLPTSGSISNDLQSGLQQQQQQQQQQQSWRSTGGSTRQAAIGAAQGQQQQQQQHSQQIHSQQIHSLSDLNFGQQQQQQELPDSLMSLQALTQQQQQQQHPLSQIEHLINQLTADQLRQLIIIWAQQSRNMSPADVTLLEPVLHCYVAAAGEQLQHGKFDRQQLADVTWGLAHFDALERREQQQQQQQQQILPLRWCGSFQAALAVPYLVLPNLMPDLDLTGFLEEITLRQDVINLQNDKGEVRAVPESRLTGWQSDIGATFCYSRKEMWPTDASLTPRVAGVRNVLSCALGQHYDSVLINYYADGKCGMRYHVDPLYDKWTPNSAVVSLGDTRQFVFRRIDDHSVRWNYKVSNGDVVFMFDDCQDVLQHAVKVEQTPDAVGPRISLVYKQRIKLSDGNWA